MTSIDTNVVVRLLLVEDADQHRRATQLVGSDEIFIPLTVLLEAAWVLRETYNQSKSAVIDAFRKLAGLPNVAFENREHALKARLGRRWHGFRRRAASDGVGASVRQLRQKTR